MLPTTKRFAFSKPQSCQSQPGQATRDSASLIAFTKEIFPSFEPASHLQLIAEHLEAVERGEIKRLAVFIPPRHGKSLLCSRMFPAWYLGRHSDRQIITASYNSELATDFGRQVRNTIASEDYQRIFPGVKLAVDSKSAGRWHTNHGGAYVAAGVGTAITGRGAHIALIDDPVKDRQEADSETIRKRVWDWYTSTLYTRLMPGGAIVLIQTRWHKDDLAGRLLDENGAGDTWKVLNLPAINDEGKALWPEWFPVHKLEETKRAIGTLDWEALYQQRPVPPGGRMFSRSWFPIISELPSKITSSCRGWDFAGTSGGGDYTVGALIHKAADGKFIIADIIRGQWSTAEVDRIFTQTPNLDGRRVRIRIPQDPGSAGKKVAHDYVRMLPGFDARFELQSGLKDLRWRPLASQAEVGNVYLLAGPWNKAFLDEIELVPGCKNDDQADAVSMSFNELTKYPGFKVAKVSGF